jgi:hypothetical protein
MLGTPHYISPEQAQGIKNLDAGTDIYSFGVVMYELSVGRVPFNADTPFSIIHDHIFTPLPLPRAINPKVPAAVERVLLKALAKDRKDRYPDVETLVKAFLEAIREVTVAAAAPAKASGTTVKANVPTPAAGSKPKPEAGAKKPPIWKRMPKWLLILLIVMVCGCMCLAAFMTLGAISERQNQKATQTAEAAVALTQSVQPPKPQTTVEKITPPSQSGKSPDDVTIPEDAREAWSQLEKGIAMFDAGEKDAAASVFETALKTMPADRTGVIILAIQKLNSRQLWMVSAKFSQKGLDKNPDDPPLRLASQEALFHVAGEKDGEGLARWMVDRIPRWAIAQGSLGRWLALYSGKSQDGEPFIRTGMELARGEEKPFVRAIMGEYMCVTGNTAEGIPLLKEVLTESNTPPWLRVELERMIEKWQPK